MINLQLLLLTLLHLLWPLKLQSLPHFFWFFQIKRKDIRILLISKYEIKTIKKLFLIFSNIINHNIFNYFCPYLIIAVLRLIYPFLWLVNFTSKWYYFVQCFHNLWCVMSICPVVKFNIVFKEEIELTICSIIDFSYETSNPLASSSLATLRVFSHQFSQYFSLYCVYLDHKFLFLYLLQTSKWSDKFLNIQ